LIMVDIVSRIIKVTISGSASEVAMAPFEGLLRLWTPTIFIFTCIYFTNDLDSLVHHK
jgi:hypothetical protein